MLHAGKIIKEALLRKGKTVTWFAQEMCCTRTHIHKIFGKKNLNSDIIWRASKILECDLFAEISKHFNAQ